MKRNVMLGLCGTATMALVSAALLRPSVAQTVATTAPSEAAPTETASTPAAPAANVAAGAVFQGEPVGGGAAITFTPVAAASAAPVAGAAASEEPNPFAETYGNSGPAGADNAPAMGAYFLRIDQPSLQQLAAAVRGAKDDAARTAATEKMQKTLNETFDADMKRREQELTKLEERLKVLRQQMTRRQAKKGEIIELQSRVLLNEADGLGFYSSEEAVYPHPGAATAAYGAVLEGAFAVPAGGGLPVAPADPARP